MKNLLSIEGIDKGRFHALLNNSQAMLEIAQRDIKKVPALRGKTIVNLFFEPSTRTRSSFEIAAKRLSADAINIAVSNSSSKKGESLLDTARNLQAMSPDAIIVRHNISGAVNFLAKHLTKTAIINAGDGTHEHPTQALLDCLTLQRHFCIDGKKRENIEGLTVAILGDVLHSRVARSNIWAHGLLNNKINLIGPTTLIPDEFAAEGLFGDARIKIFRDLREGLKGVDVVICLRMQLERQEGFFVPSLDEYSQRYCLTKKIIAECAPNIVVLHPGPINRGVEISSDVADGDKSLITDQVESGVAVRMAVLLDCVASPTEILEP